MRHKQIGNVLDTLLNTVRFASRPGAFLVLVRKVQTRLLEPGSRQRREVAEWCKSRSQPGAALASEVDSAIWEEAQSFARRLIQRANQELPQSATKFGGGGAYALLYFLVRKLQPQTVVETGVAAGWSSAAILEAMDQNGHGELWSSDFPYFRQAQPTADIGLLVEKRLRHRWHLFLDGDRANLDQILQQVDRIDLFHYDSDKSYSGREFALSQVAPRLSPKALVMFDDIQDNWHFRDTIARSPAPSAIFEEAGKYVGLWRNNGDPELPIQALLQGR